MNRKQFFSRPQISAYSLPMTSATLVIVTYLHRQQSTLPQIPQLQPLLKQQQPQPLNQQQPKQLQPPKRQQLQQPKQQQLQLRRKAPLPERQQQLILKSVLVLFETKNHPDSGFRLLFMVYLFFRLRQLFLMLAHVFV